MDINEHILKIVGSASIEEPLEMGADYHLNLTANVYHTGQEDNGDGTIDEIYKLRLLTCEIKDRLGKKIKTERTGKMSQAMRIGIISIMREIYPEMDSEEAYKKAMGVILDNLTDIVKTLIHQKDLTA